MQSSIYGFLLESSLVGSMIVLKKEGHSIIKFDANDDFEKLINLCKTADFGIFNFWLEDNTEKISHHMQWAIIAITRMLFDFKKPILVTQTPHDRKILSVLNDLLKEKSQTVFTYQDTQNLLDEIKKLLKSNQLTTEALI